MAKMLIRSVTLNIDKENYEPIIAKQKDTGRYLLFQILDNRVPYSLVNRKVRVTAIKKDGTKVFNDLTIIDAAKGICELRLTSQILFFPGWLKAELTVYEGTDTISLIPFTLDIVASIRDGAEIESTNEFSSLSTALNQVDVWNSYFESTSGKIEEKYTIRLNGLSASLAEIVPKVEGYVSVKQYKCDDGQYVKGDGIHDDTTGIQRAIDENKKIYFPNGFYKTSYMLVVQGENNTTVGGASYKYKGKCILLDHNARIIPISDFDVLKVKGSGNRIEGGMIDVSQVGTFTKSALILEALIDYRYACTSNFFDNIKLIQKNTGKTGNAILLRATENSYIYRNTFKDIEIMEFDCGIRFDNTATGSDGGINANYFNCMFWATRQPAIIRGGGNTFDFQGQASVSDATRPELACFEVQYGTRNVFNGYLYDVGTPQVKYAFEFGDGATRNTIITAYKDKAIKNSFNMYNHFVSSDKNEERMFVNPSVPGYETIEDWTMEKGHKIPFNYFYSMNGLTNILARNELINSVITTKNNISFLGINPDIQPDRVKRIFQHNKVNRDYNTICKFKKTDILTPSNLTLTINFNDDINDMFMLDTVGLQFGINSPIAIGNKADIVVKTTTSKGNIINFERVGGQLKENQINHQVLFKRIGQISYYNNKVIKLEIIINLPVDFPNSYSSLTYVYANAIDENGSGSSVASVGGDIFSGDIEFSENGIGTIIKSPNGGRFRIKVGDDGALTTIKL